MAASTQRTQEVRGSRRSPRSSREVQRICWSAWTTPSTEDPRHKVVVFCYFKPMLAMIAQGLFAKIKKGPLGAGLTTITGDITGPERDKRIQRFNNDPTCRIFLSSDAGAYGINLSQGSHLVCYDLPWSRGCSRSKNLAHRPHRLRVQARSTSATCSASTPSKSGCTTCSSRSARSPERLSTGSSTAAAGWLDQAGRPGEPSQGRSLPWETLVERVVTPSLGRPCPRRTFPRGPDGRLVDRACSTLRE